MYPPYKQSGYEQGNDWHEPGQSAGWQPQGWQARTAQQPGNWHEPRNWQPPAAPYADVHAHEVVWPPPSTSMLPAQLHHAHISPVLAKKGWPWRRSLVALSLTFAGGVYARPMLEHQARALPGEVRVVGRHLVELLPTWAQAQFTPSVSPVATVVPHRVVTTPLPPTKVEAAPAPVATPPAHHEVADQAPPAVQARAPEPVAAVAAAAPAASSGRGKEEPASKRDRHSGRNRFAKTLEKATARPATLAMAAPVAAAPAPEPVVALAAPPAARKAAPADSLDSLMARAVQEPDPSEAKPAVSANPADKRGALDRNQIADVMKGLVGAVNACGTDLVRPTNADLTVTVDPAGGVSAVKVAGPLFASMTAGCIVRTVKAAEFPASRGMTFAYRFTLKPSVRGSSPAVADTARPERITGTASSGQAPPAAAAPAERPKDLSVLPNLPSKMKVSDDPLAGLGGRSVEGKAKSKAKHK